LDAETLARKRWKPIEKAVTKREQIGRKLVEARTRVAELTSAQPAALERDRQARGLAIADGKPAPPSHAEQIAHELEQAQELVRDLEAAAVVVQGQLQEVLDANRQSWVQAQQRAIEQAGDGVLSALASLEKAVSKLEEERGLLAWIEPVPAEGSVDPHGGRLTHSATVAAALDQLRAAVAALAAGEESRQPEPGREPAWVEKRLAAKAKPGWGG
jgi:riboflavin biosynthesis pyrimidine reductase